MQKGVAPGCRNRTITYRRAPSALLASKSDSKKKVMQANPSAPGWASITFRRCAQVSGCHAGEGVPGGPCGGRLPQIQHQHIPPESLQEAPQHGRPRPDPGLLSCLLLCATLSDFAVSHKNTGCLIISEEIEDADTSLSAICEE